MAQQNSKATQEFVPIEEVRNGIVILNNGSLRAVLMVSSMNFALKSEDEQSAVLLQFQNFLNSLDFSIQIFIQSRDLDIRPYIALLEQRYTEQIIDLMKIQTREYIEFVKTFVEETDIMTKNFFVVVPYTPSIISGVGKKSGGGILSGLPLPGFGGKNKKTSAEAARTNFEENRSQLEQRIEVVTQGLVRSGIRTAQLGTEEVIELFYKLFNPGELERPIPISDVRG